MGIRKKRFRHPYLLIFVLLLSVNSIFYIPVNLWISLAFMLILLGDIFISNYFELLVPAVVCFFLAHFLYSFGIWDTSFDFRFLLLFSALAFIVSYGIFLVLGYKPDLPFAMKAIFLIYSMVISFSLGVSFTRLISSLSLKNALIAFGSVCFFITDMLVGYDILYDVDRKNLTWSFYTPALIIWNISPFLIDNNI
ncbi:MAG: lysoplasmalogenase [Leptospiraceae bacterium]|nr:lysoplasmalogenase [Leptospiraceae bacterium]